MNDRFLFNPYGKKCVVFLLCVVSLFGSWNGKCEPKETGKQTDLFGERSLQWSSETNGLRVALVVNSISASNSSVVIIPVFENRGTNILQIYLPPVTSRFTMMVSDSRGNIIPISSNKLGQPLTQPFKLTTGINLRAGYIICPPLYPNRPEIVEASRFALNDYVSITNLEWYHLKLSMDVIWFSQEEQRRLGENRRIPIVHLPPVQVDIQFKKEK